jgi:N-methylhydantoinase A
VTSFNNICKDIQGSMAVAESDVILALYVGESFAEAHLSQNKKKLHFHRWYLGKDGLKGGLIKFMQESGIEKISKAYVASRFPEKVLAYRLGGSVAVLTTQGFENWPGTRQPLNSKASALSSMDLLFAVDERTTAAGVVEREVGDVELTEIVEKLKQKQAKRICIHFLNAAQNSQNQQKVKSLLQQQGFEVFTPDQDALQPDEAALWRKNILNASLSGTFEEVQEDVHTALQTHLPEGQRAFFISGEGQLFDKENQHRLSSLWGASHIWARGLQQKSKPNLPFEILYLGLEMFTLLHPQKKNKTWQSPWGQVQSDRVQSHPLALQPTTAIELSPWNELSFSRTSIGYEPGPMFMGRGQLPTLLDLWGAETEGILGLDDRRSPQGLQKFKNQLWALNKAAAQPIESEDNLQSSLKQWALQKLAAELILNCESRKIICLGALAPLFGAELKKRLPEFNFEILAETETASMLGQGH